MISKILIINLSNLGDAILTYPAVAAVCHAHPNAELHVLTSSRTKDLFQNDPRFSKIWVWEKKAGYLKPLSLVIRLFLERYSLVVDFRDSLIPFFLLGARRTPISRRFLDPRQHRADFHLRLLEKIGIYPAQGDSLPYGPAEEKQIAQWLTRDRCVVMAPGARSHLKRWSAQRFAEVADCLSQAHGAQVILVGGEEDRPIASAVVSAMRQPALDLTGKTTLPQLAALLKKAQLVVTNDSACLHAAQAMGAPTVAIFGPTDEKKYGPRLSHSTVVRRSLVCAPCEKALCQYNHECMTGLETQEVLEAAVRILEKS